MPETCYSIHRASLCDVSHSAEHLGVGVFDAPQVVPETVLVQLLAGLFVPETAGVGRDLIRKHEVALGVLSGLYLEVDEDYAAFVEERREDLVDLEAQLLAELQVLVGDTELPEVIPVQQGVSELVVLVAQLDYRGLELA